MRKFLLKFLRDKNCLHVCRNDFMCNPKAGSSIISSRAPTIEDKAVPYSTWYVRIPNDAHGTIHTIWAMMPVGKIEDDDRRYEWVKYLGE